MARAALVRAARAVRHGFADGPLGSLVSLAAAIGVAALMLHAIQARDEATDRDSNQIGVRRGTVMNSGSPAGPDAGASLTPRPDTTDRPIVVVLLDAKHQSLEEMHVPQNLVPELDSEIPPLTVVTRMAATADVEADVQGWIDALRMNLAQAVIVIDLRYAGTSASADRP